MVGDAAAWSRERVLALAPDAASATAGERLGTAAPWSGTGRHGPVLWGSCRGSGATPYQTLVHLDGPAFRCSCPSRKFPCKHALGLLLLWSAGQVADAAEPPAHAAEWVAARAERATRPAPRERAAAVPSAQRVDRARLGLDELDVWLADQARGGLAALQRGGYGPVDQMAARMVDAQAPGVAGMLRTLPARFVGDGWPARTLEHLALVRLLVAAHRRVDDLPPDLAATVRSRVGYPTSKESVLALPAVRDRWAVLGQVDVDDYRLTTRRVWLRGASTGRWAVLVSFAAGGGPLDASVLPGLTVDGDLHFYPGAGQHRALLGVEHARDVGVHDVPAESVTEAADRFGGLLALDPWAELLPVVLRGAPVPPDREGARWRFRDPDGAAVPMVAGAEAWPLLARSMGDPIEVAGEWTRDGFRPLTFLPHPLDPVFSTAVVSG